MDVFETTSTNEEVNFHDDQEPVINYHVQRHPPPHHISSQKETETDSDSDSESLRNELNRNYGGHHAADKDIDTEDFTNQINEEDQSRPTPLYGGSPMSVYAACMRLIRLSHSLNLNKNGLQSY